MVLMRKEKVIQFEVNCNENLIHTYDDEIYVIIIDCV